MTRRPHPADPGAASAPVLVVDDEEGSRELIGTILRSEGFSVATATGGAEGVRLATELRPVVIVLDVVMPDLDGWAVLQQLKADPELATIPVVMNTVLAEQSQGYVLGAADYLTKPIDRHELLRVVSRHVRRRRLGPIVVVEPDEGTLEITSAVLQEQGWPVIEARTGREALERITQTRPCLVLLDPFLPELDGFALLEELCHTPAWQGIPVLALVGRRLTLEQERLLGRHTSWIFRKGTHSLEELQGKILELVEGLAAAGL